jgi:hypothetical protein
LSTKPSSDADADADNTDDDNIGTRNVFAAPTCDVVDIPATAHVLKTDNTTAIVNTGAVVNTTDVGSGDVDNDPIVTVESTAAIGDVACGKNGTLCLTDIAVDADYDFWYVHGTCACVQFANACCSTVAEQRYNDEYELHILLLTANSTRLTRHASLRESKR